MKVSLQLMSLKMQKREFYLNELFFLMNLLQNFLTEL
jgi:hypothetical protein